MKLSVDVFDPSVKGAVFNISRFCVDDGPGIRTTVFLMGCPLHCAWCHNPEGILSSPVIMLDASKCTECRQCTTACADGCHVFGENGRSFNRDGCRLCGGCVSECRNGALEIKGRYYAPDEIMKIVEKDIPFYKSSGGGLTISGGEPLYQPKFTKALLELCRSEGIHTCIETSGAAGSETLSEVAGAADLVLLDCKGTDPEMLSEYTGFNLNGFYSALDILSSMEKPVILRCPIIKGVNFNSEHFAAVAEIADKYDNILAVRFLPYHELGMRKAKGIFSEQKRFDEITPEEITSVINKSAVFSKPWSVGAPV